MPKTEFIKVCPFCGSYEVNTCRTNENACWIECSICYATTQSDKTRGQAIKIWNRRYAQVVNVGADIKYDGDREYKASMRRIRRATK